MSHREPPGGHARRTRWVLSVALAAGVLAVILIALAAR